MVNRIPGGSRLTTVTEAPNNERIRRARAGPNPKSRPGVLDSSTAKRSKSFGSTESGIVLPQLSITTLGAADLTSLARRTVSPSSENRTAVSSKARNALASRSSSPSWTR